MMKQAGVEEKIKNMSDRLYEVPRFRVSGDRALLVEYGEEIDLAVNERVCAMAELLLMHPFPGLENVLPAYRSLCIVYDPLLTGISTLKNHVLKMQQKLSRVSTPPPETIEIPVAYGGELGPDMDFVSDFSGLSVGDVIHLHSCNPYHIHAIGFAPGFCYLGELDPRLRTPRLETPRTLVPAGSVGIAESQTGVYPLASPGGWRLIGRTPLKLFDPARTPPFLYKTGDKIRFTPVSRSEYERILIEGTP